MPLPNAATRPQTAQLKSRPGRQEWEKAPQFLRNSARASGAAERARAEGFSIQCSTAQQLKDQGNEVIDKVRAPRA